jgi:hypothetical protein
VEAADNRVVRFEKEEPETRLFLPKAGLMSLFAEVQPVREGWTLS